LITITPDPENSLTAGTLLLQPKTQSLPDRLSPGQAPLPALRIESRAVGIWQINDRTHGR
jgi:hypothetical protein